MSIPSKSSATEQEAPPALVPKLRFPEFRAESGWQRVNLAKVCDMKAGRFVAASEIFETSNGGRFPCYGGNGLRGFTESFTHDGVVALIGRQGALCGNVRLVSGRFHATEHAVVCASKGTTRIRWLYYALDNQELNRLATGQAQPGLSVDVLAGVSLGVPAAVSEQQKIAECLSSLDDRIAAQARRVEALKTHKTGLMQQLFPRDGETQPRLRFPEFRDAGVWYERQVHQLAKVTTGARDTQNRVADGLYPFFVRSQTVERIDTYSYDGEAVLTSGDGVGVGKNFHYIDGKFDFHQRVYCIYEFAPEINAAFFFHYFAEHFGERVLRMSAKNSVDSVRMAMITEMPIRLPSLPEQQRIAECLGSLDALISAETRYLNVLKTHKKGLMQQLFPVVEEVGA